MNRLLCLLLAMMGLACAAHAQPAEPDLVFAFDQFSTNGPVPFAKALYPGQPDVAKAFVGHLEAAGKGLGGYIGYEVLGRKPLCRRVERVLLVIYFEKGPIYLRLDYYESLRFKLCLPALVSTDPSEVLPLDLISAAGR